MTEKTQNLPKVRQTKNTAKMTTKNTPILTEKGKKRTKNNGATSAESGTRYKKAAATTEKKTVPEDESQQKREALIKREVRRLGDTFKNVESEKKRLVKATIEDAAFLTVTMQQLRETINREGTEIEYQNGENQWGKKQSPAVLSYLQMSQKLAAAMKILIDCQPKTEKAPEPDDRFDSFIEERGDD